MSGSIIDYSGSESKLAPLADKCISVVKKHVSENSTFLGSLPFFSHLDSKVAKHPCLNFYATVNEEVAHRTTVHSVRLTIEHRSYMGETPDDDSNFARAELYRLYASGDKKVIAKALNDSREDLYIYALRFDNGEGFNVKEKEKIYFMELELVAASLTT